VEGDGSEGVPYWLGQEDQAAYTQATADQTAGVWGEYTPNDFVLISQHPDSYVEHNLRVMVAAGPEEVFAFLDNWGNLVHCFDLIDTVCGRCERRTQPSAAAADRTQARRSRRTRAIPTPPSCSSSTSGVRVGDEGGCARSSLLGDLRVLRCCCCMGGEWQWLA